MVRFRKFGAVALVVLAASCSAPPQVPQTAAAQPMTLDQLAAGIGCELQSQRGAEELSQGACETGEDKNVLVSFSTDEAAQTWLTEAKPWGGHYLRGARWVIVGTEPQLKTFQQKVGGEIVSGDEHGSTSGHGH